MPDIQTPEEITVDLAKLESDFNNLRFQWLIEDQVAAVTAAIKNHETETSWLFSGTENAAEAAALFTRAGYHISNGQLCWQHDETETYRIQPDLR